MEEIKVHVVRYPARDNLVMRYVDPGTGKQITRSTGTTKRKEAESLAAKWEAELQEGRYKRTSRMPWDRFCMEFMNDVSPRLRLSTCRCYSQTLDAFERLCRPAVVGDLTTMKVTTFVAELRKQVEGERPRSEATIAAHLRQLKVAARWANRQGMLPNLPTFDMPKRRATAKMKGRPITLEEFERMLAAVPKAIEARPQVGGVDAVEPWRFLLRGLWATGLRLGEALALRWDHEPGGVSVDLDGPSSVLVFDADSQKSGRDELCPLTPEAVRLLTPHQRKRGWVFDLVTTIHGEPMARDLLKVSKTIAKIGRESNVVTNPGKGTTATAHDLRRSFGARWAKLVMPSVLKDIMRHAEVSTTLTYYARHNARTTAAELWAVAPDDSGSKLGSRAEIDDAEIVVSPYVV